MVNLSSGGKKNLRTWFSSKFTYDFIENVARETGFLQRKRKLDPVYLIIVLIFGISSHRQPTLEEIYRRYTDFDDNPKFTNPILHQSFRNRFNDKLVTFLQVLLEHYMNQMINQSSASLKGIAGSFKDILIQDSSIIRLSKKLYELHPAARSRDNSAGLKIHAVYSTVTHSIKNAQITTERVHDAKMFDIKPDVKGTLLIDDLGYYSLKKFALIQDYGGFFISRVKSNAAYCVSRIISGPSDLLANVDPNCFKNIKLADFLDRVPNSGEFDLICSVHIGDEKINKEKVPIFREFRVVCIWNSKAHKWHMYITNLDSEYFSNEEVYELYRFRWVIELIFKELKSDYDLGNLFLGNAPLAYVHIYSMLLRLIISRDLYTWIVSLSNKRDAKKYTPTMWSKIFAEKALEFLSILNQQFFESCNIYGRWRKLERSLRRLALTRNDPEVLSLKFSEVH
jgi:hypothetical protein